MYIIYIMYINMCTYFVYVYVQNENSIYLPAFVLVKKYNSQYLLQKNLLVSCL